jgi:hypothetical protein
VTTLLVLALALALLVRLSAPAPHTSLTATFRLPSPSRNGVGRRVREGVVKDMCGSIALRKNKVHLMYHYMG